MIAEGDRVMVCLSGGKDSYTLLDVLLSLKRSAPIDFELIAVNLDQKQPDFPADVLPNYLRALGVPFHVIEQDTYSVVKRVIPEGKTMCGLCSRLRRGALYRYAAENGITKIALGHHRDDIVETLFLNMFHGGRLKAMAPKLKSDDGRHIVIRPLAYVAESLIERYARARQFPIIPCKLCGSQDNAQRKEVKRMLAEWERQYPGPHRVHLLGAAQRRDRPPGRSRGFRFSGAGCRTLPNPNKPLGESYWVIEDRLLAGRYPGGKTPKEAERRVGVAARCGLRRLHRSDRSRASCRPTTSIYPAARCTCASRFPTTACRAAPRAHGRDPGGARRRRWPAAGACTCTAAPASAAPARWSPAISSNSGLSPDAALIRLNELWQGNDRSAHLARRPGDRRAARLHPRLDRAGGRSRRRSPDVMDAARTLRERFQGALVGLAVGDALAAHTQFRKPGSFAAVGRPARRRPVRPAARRLDRRHRHGAAAGRKPARARGFRRARPGAALRALAARGLWQRHRAMRGHLGQRGAGAGDGAVQAPAVRRLARPRTARQGPAVARRAGRHVLLRRCAGRGGQGRRGGAASRRRRPWCSIACGCWPPWSTWRCRAATSRRSCIRRENSWVDARTRGRKCWRSTTARTRTACRRKSPAAAASCRRSRRRSGLFTSSETFREGALLAANLGRDSDVVAAAYGQFAGAYHGVSAIPGIWRNSLMKQEVVIDSADRLLTHALVTLGTLIPQRESSRLKCRPCRPRVPPAQA